MVKRLIPIDYYLDHLKALEKHHNEQMQVLWARMDKYKKWDEDITVLFQELDELLKKQKKHFEDGNKDDDNDNDNVCA